LGILIAAWVFTLSAAEVHASLIVVEDLHHAHLEADGMSAGDEIYHPLPSDLPAPTLDQPLAVPGTAGTAISVTTTVAGHVAMVAAACAPQPALVVRLMGEITLLFPDPPPTGLLRPPKW
jgi:hypothetical protein